MRSLLLASLLVAVAVPGAQSQLHADSLPESTRIRVHVHSGNRTRFAPTLQGRLVSLTPDSLTIRVAHANAPVQVPRPRIYRIDRSRGMPSRSMTLWGAPLGALAGTAVWNWLDRNDQRPGFGIEVAAVLGAGLGAVTAHNLRRERWERVRFAPAAAPGPPVSVYAPAAGADGAADASRGTRTTALPSAAGSH